MGGVILLATEARNDRPSRRGTPETYSAGPRGRLPACSAAPAPQPCGVREVGTRRAQGPVPDRTPRAPSDRSRYRPTADRESLRPVAGRFYSLGPWSKERKMAQSLPLPRRGPSSRIGQSCATGSHSAPRHPRWLLSPMPSPAPSSRDVGPRRRSDTASSQCGCGWL